MEMVIIDKVTAKEQGLKSYFTGLSCKKFHVDKRYINTDICYECKRLQAKRDYKNHSNRVIKTNNKSRLKNKDKVKERSKLWVKNNRERSNSIKRAWKLRNREKYLKMERDRIRKKRQKDPLFKLNRNISKSIWESLKGLKLRRTWESLVSFKFIELKERLESLFNKEMSWENYGSYWELDHIKPLSKCASFEEAWKLTNLQPLTLFENRSKGSKWEGE